MKPLGEVEADYRELYPLYEQYVSKLQSLLSDMAHDAQIDVAQVEGRAKSIESFLEKVQRKSYGDPLRQITDLAGLRIITYYADDVVKIAELVRREFDVLTDESSDKFEQLDVDEFGYRSWHIVVSLAHPRSTLLEWKRFLSFSAEIQIRSVLQHAWAAISHKLDYKKSAQAPSPLRRQLFRLSALLELADEEFASVRDGAIAIAAQYSRELRAGDLDLPLDFEALSAFSQQRVDMERWGQIGRRAGLAPYIYDLPNLERIEINRLLITLQAAGLESISQFAELLDEVTDEEAQISLEEVNKATLAQGERLEASPVDIITIIVSLKRSDNLPSRFDWGGSLKKGIVRALRQTISPANDKT